MHMLDIELKKRIAKNRINAQRRLAHTRKTAMQNQLMELFNFACSQTDIVQEILRRPDNDDE